MKAIKQLKYEEAFSFSTFQNWCNTAKEKFAKFRRWKGDESQQIICLDIDGNCLTLGEDFAKAEEENLFPVTCYRLIRTIEATAQKEETETLPPETLSAKEILMKHLKILYAKYPNEYNEVTDIKKLPEYEMLIACIEAYHNQFSKEALPLQKEDWGWTCDDKKLLFELSDGMDVSGLTMALSGCMEYIKADIDYSLESKDEIKEYTLTPKWRTDEEFNNLPECEF